MDKLAIDSSDMQLEVLSVGTAVSFIMMQRSKDHPEAVYPYKPAVFALALLNYVENSPGNGADGNNWKAPALAILYQAHDIISAKANRLSVHPEIELRCMDRIEALLDRLQAPLPVGSVHPYRRASTLELARR